MRRSKTACGEDCASLRTSATRSDSAAGKPKPRKQNKRASWHTFRPAGAPPVICIVRGRFELDVFVGMSCVQFGWSCNASLMMRVGVNGCRDERNIRSHEYVMARLDCDFSPVVPATEPHLSFGHFQPRGVTTCKQTEGRAHDNGFALRRCKDEWVPGRLF